MCLRVRTATASFQQGAERLAIASLNPPIRLRSFSAHTFPITALLRSRHGAGQTRFYRRRDCMPRSGRPCWRSFLLFAHLQALNSCLRVNCKRASAARVFSNKTRPCLSEPWNGLPRARCTIRKPIAKRRRGTTMAQAPRQDAGIAPFDCCPSRTRLVRDKPDRAALK